VGSPGAPYDPYPCGARCSVGKGAKTVPPTPYSTRTPGDVNLMNFAPDKFLGRKTKTHVRELLWS
jgi:hypothetical protein